MKHKEDHEQGAFFDWVRMQTRNGKPLIDLVWATPNGGNRKMLEAKRMKHQGVKAGVLDITIAIAIGEYHGMFIEMKVDDNPMSSAQVKFKQSVTDEGFFCVICYSAEDAIDELELYLNGEGGIPEAGIAKAPGEKKFLAVCRRMKSRFKTRRGAVGWLRRRGFNENGDRI